MGNVLLDQDIWNVVAFLRAISDAPYQPSANDVTPLNANKSAEFKELQEIVEAQLGGAAAISKAAALLRVVTARQQNNVN